MKTALRTPSRLLRTSIARGLAGDQGAVDPLGGDQGQGIIRGMAILSRGEALGHGLWCDSFMLGQCVDAINSTGDKGVKARFTHPDISGDGLGKYTGRVKNAQLEGDIVRGDLHFAKAAHETPDGDLAGYLMTLGAEDPEAFGNSIAFVPDMAAEEQFWSENSQDGEFASPDPDNADNLPHARLETLMAVDAVDDPAANPNGLFHRGHSLISEAERLMAFSLGLSSERPRLIALDADPDRVAGFVQRFLSRHNLSLAVKDKTMTTAQLDAQLRQHFSVRPQDRKLAAGPADKEDKKEQIEKGAEEEGDADKDEGEDKGKDEKRGDNYASDEGDGDDDELDDPDEKKEMADPDDAREGLADGSGDEDDKDPSKADKNGPEKAKRMAKGGDAPGGATAGDEASRQKAYQDVQEEEEEESKKPAKKGTTVESPGTEPGAIGPLGDPSHNVGYSKAVKECRRFTKAFGPQGAVWFGEGKSFAEAQELHAQALADERDELRQENKKLKAKLAAKRGVDPLSGETSVGAGPGKRGMETFAAGLAEQLGRKNLN